MTKVDTSSDEGEKILQLIRQSNFDNNFTDRYWKIQQLEVVHNDKLSKHHDCFKNELKSLGRGDNDLADILVYTVETEKTCKDICREGYKVGLRKRHVLGYTGSGIHLVRNFDILSRYITYQHFSSPAYIMVSKAFLGKAKPIVPRLHKDDDFVAPWTGFDCHTSARKIGPDMHICEALNCSYVYFYEYDDISSNTVKYPRQILPYAVLQLTKKYSLGTETPFLAVRRSKKYSNIEVMGETRRGFRFTYYESNKRKKQLYTRHRSTKELIKTSLKEQLLEMRTTGDIKSTPPVLKKNVVDVQNYHTYNTTDEQEESPVLLKCDMNTFSFNGKTYFLPLKEKDPNRTLLTDQIHRSENPYSRPNCRASRWKVHRLPLHMKPFVSLKRLQLDLKSLRKQNRIRNCKGAMIRKLQVEEKDSENKTLSESCLYESDKVTQKKTAMTGDSVVDPCKQELNTYALVKKYAKDESNGSDKQNENSFTGSCLGSASSFIKPNGAVHISKNKISCSKNDDRQSLILTDTARELSQVGNIQDCKVESKSDKTKAPKAGLQRENSNTCSSMKAKEPVDQLQNIVASKKRSTFNQELNEKCDSQSEETSSPTSNKGSQQQNKLLTNDVGCELDKRVESEIMGDELGAFGSVEQRKVKSNGTDNGLKIVTFSKNHTGESKSVGCGLDSDSEKIEFDTTCKKDSICGKTKWATRFSKKSKRKVDRHNISQVSKNRTDVNRKSSVKRLTKRSSSKITGSRKRTYSRAMTEESTSVKDSDNESLNDRKRQKYKNSSCVPFLESQLYPKTLASLSLPPSQSTVAKSCTDSFQIQTHVPNVDLDGISGSKNSKMESTKVFRRKAKAIALDKSEQPKTVMDLFKEPLCKGLIERIKSNDQLKNDVSFSYQMGLSTLSTHTNATSPPVGVIAPSQLDFSPKVAEAKTYGLKELQAPGEITSSGLDFTKLKLPCDMSKENQTGQGLQADLSDSQPPVKTIPTNSMSITESKQTSFGTNGKQCTCGWSSNKLHCESSLFRSESTLTSQFTELNAVEFCDLSNHTSQMNKKSLQPSDELNINSHCAMITSHSLLSQTHQSPTNQTQKAFSSQISDGKEQSKFNFVPDDCYSLDDNMITPENCFPVRETVSPSLSDSKTLHKNESFIAEIRKSNKCVPHASDPFNEYSERANSFEKPISKPAGNLQAEKCRMPESISTPGKDLSNKSQISDTKSNLLIDADIAAKLQRVLRKHIAEVQKNPSLSRQPSSKTEVTAKSEKKHSSVNHKTNFDLTCTPLCLNAFENYKTTTNEDMDEVSNNIDSHEYNLHLLASQTIQDGKIIPPKNETSKNSESKTLHNFKENYKSIVNINATADVLAEHLSDGSQDTVIGGIRLSPLRQDSVFEYTEDSQMKESYSVYPLDAAIFSEKANDTENTGSKSKYNFVQNDQSKSTFEKVLLSHKQEVEKEENAMQKEVIIDKIQYKDQMESVGTHIDFDVQAPNFDVVECITTLPLESITCSDKEKLSGAMQAFCVEDGGFKEMFNNKDQIPSDNTIKESINDPMNTRKEGFGGNRDYNSPEQAQSHGSRIFGRIHTLGNVNELENKRSLSSCRNAVIDTFQDLSQTSKAFNITDLQNDSGSFRLQHNKTKQNSLDSTIQETVPMPENNSSSKRIEFSLQNASKIKANDPLPPVAAKAKLDEESQPIVLPETAVENGLEIVKVIHEEQPIKMICENNLTSEDCDNEQFIFGETFSERHTYGQIYRANVHLDEDTGNSKPLQQTEYSKTHSQIKKEALFPEVFHTSDQESESCIGMIETSESHLYRISIRESIADDTTSTEAQEKNSICKKSNHAHFDNLNTSEPINRKTEMQFKVSPLQTGTLENITRADFARTGKTGSQNRDMTEKRNIYDTKLGIQRMRAKLSNTIISLGKIKHSSMENPEPDSCKQEAVKSRPRNLIEFEGNSESPVLVEENDKSRICSNTEIGCSQKDVTSVITSPVCQNDDKWTPTKDLTASKNALMHEADSKCSEIGLKEKEKCAELKSRITSKKDNRYKSLHRRCNFSNEHPFTKESERKSRQIYLQKNLSKYRGNETLTHVKDDKFWLNGRIPVISDMGTKVYEDFGNCEGLDHVNEIGPEAVQEKNTFEHEIDTKNAKEDCTAHFIKSREQTTKPKQNASRSKNSSGSSNCRRDESEHHTGRGRLSQNTSNSSTATDLLSNSNLISYRAQAHSCNDKQQNYSAGSFKRFSNMHGKTGYFSWRRKYQTSTTRVFRPEKRFATRRLQTEEEQREWKMFKERERIRLQIEQAVKDYRRTFENTEDDFVGDEKVSKYLHSLSEKLEHIQSKRNLLIRPEHNRRSRSTDNKGRNPEMEMKEETTKLFVHRQKDEPPADTMWMKHLKKFEKSNLIEKILQEHINREFEKVTEKLRLDLTTEFAKGIQTIHATKGIHEVCDKERRFGFSRTVGDKNCTEEACVYESRSSVPVKPRGRQQFHSNGYGCNKYSSNESCPSASTEKNKYTHLGSRSRSRDRYSERHYSSGNCKTLNAENHKKICLKTKKRSSSRSVSPHRIYTGTKYNNCGKRQHGHVRYSRYSTRHYSRSRSKSPENKNHKYRSPVLRNKGRYSSFHRQSRSRSRSRETPPRKKKRNGSDNYLDFDDHYNMDNLNSHVKENGLNTKSCARKYNIDNMNSFNNSNMSTVRSKWDDDDSFDNEASNDVDLLLEQDFHSDKQQQCNKSSKGWDTSQDNIMEYSGTLVGQNKHYGKTLNEIDDLYFSRTEDDELRKLNNRSNSLDYSNADKQSNRESQLVESFTANQYERRYYKKESRNKAYRYDTDLHHQRHRFDRRRINCTRGRYMYYHVDDSSGERSPIPPTLYSKCKTKSSTRHTWDGNGSLPSNNKEVNGDIAANCHSSEIDHQSFDEAIPASSHKSLRKSYLASSPKTSNSGCHSHPT